MRLVVLGSGALGCVVAGYLARAGHDVCVVGRADRIRALNERPLRVSGLADFDVPIRWAAAGAVPDADALIVAVKTFQTAQALADLGEARFEVALSFQNGLVKNESLERRFPGRVLGATTQVGGELVEPGHARHVLDGRTYLGELGGGGSDRVTALADAFDQAGLPTEARTDIRGVEWAKLCQYAGAALLAATSRRMLHEIYLDPDLARLYLGVVREAAATADRDGVTVAFVPGFPIARLASLEMDEALADTHARGESMRERGITSVRSSMLQALEAGRPLELEDTVGWLMERARHQGAAVPTIEPLYRLVRAASRLPA